MADDVNVDPFVAIDALIEDYRSDNRAFGEWVGHIPLSKLKPLIEQARSNRDVYFGRWKDERALHLHALGELKHALAAARQEPETPAAPLAWQPIETAPKDGTPFIAANTMDSFRAFFDTDEDAQCWIVEDTGLMFGSLRFPPTHWMPLPPASVSAPSTETSK